MNRKKPEHIATVVNKLLADPEWQERLKAALPLLRWQEVVGIQIAREAQPESFRNGILQVKVENPVWLSHLRFLGEELRHRLNSCLAFAEIKEIRFRQGPLDTPSRPPSGPAAAPKVSRPPRAPGKAPPLSAEQQSLLETISDFDLRQALENLLRTLQEHPRT
ncbi:MAG: DciA family protein [Syntrophobacteria bacterium]